MLKKGASGLRVMPLLIIILLFSMLVLAHEEYEEGRDDNTYEDTLNAKLNRAAFIASAFGALCAGLVICTGMKQKKKRPFVVVGWIALIAVTALVGYSYYYFHLTADESEGITVCEAGQCFWATHMHAQLIVEICGEEWDPGLEKGDLGKVHTHKERGKLHFHERLPVDPETKKVTSWEPLKLKTLFEDIGVRFNSECFLDNCNGDLCGEVTGTLSMAVNGEPNAEYEEYAYKDGEVINLTFG